MRSLADWEIPRATVWSNQFGWSAVRQTSRRTVGGRLAVWKQRLRGGQPITLEFRSRRVLLRYADVLRLMEMAGASGQSFVFIWDVGQYVVIFDHENDPHDFTPVFGYNNPSDDRYTGRINLVSIGRA